MIGLQPVPITQTLVQVTNFMTGIDINSYFSNLTQFDCLKDKLPCDTISPNHSWLLSSALRPCDRLATNLIEQDSSVLSVSFVCLKHCRCKVSFLG